MKLESLKHVLGLLGAGQRAVAVHMNRRNETYQGRMTYLSEQPGREPALGLRIAERGRQRVIWLEVADIVSVTGPLDGGVA